MESSTLLRVHPVVLASILDAYERRGDQPEVIGVLMGTHGKRIIEVTGSFSIPHKNTQVDVLMNLEFSHSMTILERKANRSRVPVGWYATGTEIKEHYKLIHQSRYMSRSASAPFLLINANVLIGDKISAKAYICREVGIPGGTRGHIFVPIEVEIDCYGPERCSVEMMAYTLDPRSKLQPELGDDMINLHQLCQHLMVMLDKVICYVDNVIEEKCPADPKIGRAIAQLIFSIPKLEPDHLEQLINSSYKDLLMVTYLTNLIRTHLKLLNLAQ